MLKIANNSLENLLASTDMVEKDELIGRSAKLFKSQKLKKLAKSKNPASLFKFQKISITDNIGVMGFLTFKAKVTFIQLRKAFNKASIF